MLSPRFSQPLRCVPSAHHIMHSHRQLRFNRQCVRIADTRHSLVHSKITYLKPEQIQSQAKTNGINVQTVQFS